MNRPKAVARNHVDMLLAFVVATVALGFAAVMLFHYASDPDPLWRGVLRDRNGHFAFGVNLALAIRSFDVIAFFDELLRARVWPPVHGLVLATIFVPGGPDMRFAIVPSLIGWTATVIFVWLIARRLFADRISGIAAAAIAVIFAIASPGFRLLGSDVMLEGLGAGLSASILYFYLRASATPDDPRWWRLVALGLTILFFEKYNYWAIVAVALAIAFVAEHPRGSLAWARKALAAFDLKTALARILADPLVLAAIAVSIAVVFIYAKGPMAISLFGRAISLYPPENLTTVAYAFLFAGVALWWRRNRETLADVLGERGLMVLRWHVLPVAISFLIPKRISGFLWFLGPGNSSPLEHTNPFAAAGFHWAGFAEGFHVASWSALLVLVLAAIGTARIHRLAPGARAIAIFALLNALAVLIHPHQQWRFQATGLFAWWLCAGIGGAFVLQWTTASLPRSLRTGIVVLLATALIVAHAFQRPTPQAYAVAIRSLSEGSDLALARAILPLVPGQGPVGIVSNLGRSPFVQWVLRTDCDCRRIVDEPWPGATREETRRLTEAWLATTKAERILAFDAAQSYDPLPRTLTDDSLRGGFDALVSQNRFVRTDTVYVSDLAAEVTVWQRHATARRGSAAQGFGSVRLP